MFVVKKAYLSVNRVEKPGMATDNSLTGMETLEGFVMGLYLEAFQALVSLINRYESLYLYSMKNVVYELLRIAYAFAWCACKIDNEELFFLMLFPFESN